MTISSRRLLDLLAGKVSHEEWAKEFGWGVDGRANPFERKLAQLQMIASVSVSPSETADDDEITFTFAAGNPSVTPFLG